ncbi:MAG: PilZ domain-containing protein [Acidobacteriia bacterium]|nr:PilZ domain-containing protein [Terriglobia bacterium]
METGVETDARVVGPIMGEEEGCYYGLELLHPEANLWGIDFPPLAGTESAAGRMLLECSRCHSQQVVRLDVFGLEVLLANECLMYPCRQCKDASLWMVPVRSGGQVSTSPAVPQPRHPFNERKEPRVSLTVDVCIRHPVHGDELVVTENVSRGGFRFRSRRDYAVGTLIEAALPYASGAANIFAPARVVYKEDAGKEGTIAYGVAYVPAQMASSLTGMRIARPG